MDKLKWIIVITIIVIWTGLAVFSGYHLKKDKVCPEIRIKNSTYTVPLPPQHASLEVTKPATPIYSDSIPHPEDSCEVYPWFEPYKPKYYNQLTDTVIIFQNDSLDFVADINFSTKDQKFENFFDFNLRVSQRIKEVVREVLVPMKPEIYQEPFVILLMVITSFLFGIAL